MCVTCALIRKLCWRNSMNSPSGLYFLWFWHSWHCSIIHITGFLHETRPSSSLRVCKSGFLPCSLFLNSLCVLARCTPEWVHYLSRLKCCRSQAYWIQHSHHLTLPFWQQAYTDPRSTHTDNSKYFQTGTSQRGAQQQPQWQWQWFSHPTTTMTVVKGQDYSNNRGSG